MEAVQWAAAHRVWLLPKSLESWRLRGTSMNSTLLLHFRGSPSSESFSGIDTTIASVLQMREMGPRAMRSLIRNKWRAREMAPWIQHAD